MNYVSKTRAPQEFAPTEFDGLLWFERRAQFERKLERCTWAVEKKGFWAWLWGRK